jgi:hypothetical protein
MNNYIKNTNEDEFYKYIKSLHVSYYGWHDLPQGLWIINDILNKIITMHKWFK